MLRCQELVVSGFSKLLGSQKDENWPLPTMYAVCLDLRLLALKADRLKRKDLRIYWDPEILKSLHP